MATPLNFFDHRRLDLTTAVNAILASASNGRVIHTDETQGIDFKEEAGRRSGPIIEPGQPTNNAAADKLADECACMANSPGGGALILGIEDKSGRIIGTELKIDWLRQAIYSRIDVAPDIVEARADGQRVLVIYVAPAPEPVEDCSGRLRWRVGDSCRPVDRSEWWQYQRTLHHLDPMGLSTQLSVSAARPRAMEIARRQFRGPDQLTDEEILRQLGAIDAEGHMTQASALLFSSVGTSIIELTVFDVFGGAVRKRVVADPTDSALEQLESIEQALDVINQNNTVVEGLTHQPVPEIPSSAVREALLNAMIHRDWNRSEPIDVRWIELDSTLIVRSPGGFPSEITSKNVLSNRHARYPALADLFRALRFVDKQGVGVDRMYQAMITIGHRPPSIEEVAGPFVETTLVGGRPVVPVLELISKIVPQQRQHDYRIAIVLYLLFHRPFVTEETVAEGLQSGAEAARATLEAARQTTVDGHPLIIIHQNAWLLGSAARAILKQGDASVFSPGDYLTTDRTKMSEAAMLWLREIGDITSADLAALTDTSRGTAKNCLNDMAEQGQVEVVGAGRSHRYRLAKQ